MHEDCISQTSVNGAIPRNKNKKFEEFTTVMAHKTIGARFTQADLMLVKEIYMLIFYRK